MLYQVHLAISGIQTILMIDTDHIGSCKSNYHTITTTTAPNKIVNHYVSNISGAKYQ